MMDREKLTAALNEVRDLLLASAIPFDAPDDRPPGYAEFERDALKIFIGDALDFPNSKWNVWKVMADEIIKFNAIQRRDGAHEFRLISFDGFLRKIEEAERNRQ